jgi:uncharacterized membrane protein YqaE (UPF0057 family)
MAVTCSDILKIILAIILPPLGVFAEKEACDKDVLINILLTILGFIPGKLVVSGRVAALARTHAQALAHIPHKLLRNPADSAGLLVYQQPYLTFGQQHLQYPGFGLGCLDDPSSVEVG